VSTDSGQPSPQLAAEARSAGKLALDTEFVGEGRYRTLLCLVQLAVPESAGMAERIELVDPLAPELDGAPLAALLADPAVQVVVHAGRQDVALMRRRFATEVRNVFDTQVAAGFVGLGAQSSYESLLVELLGIRLSKSASFTRWDARPLSPEQLAYAREDVVHLLELSSALERRLAALGRLDWAREECAPLEQASDERDPDAIFSRLPRVRGLSASARPIARELVRWREQTAARQDRPAQSVLSDSALIEVAKRKPTSAHELGQIRGVQATSLRRKGGELLEAIERGRRLPPEPVPHEARRTTPRPEDAALVALAEALVRARAREAGLAYELLATRADLHAIVATGAADHATSGGASGHGAAGEADVRTLRGWRRELVGEELLELLDGRLSLSVAERGLQIVKRSRH
jgi:ribonuclease D